MGQSLALVDDHDLDHDHVLAPVQVSLVVLQFLERKAQNRQVLLLKLGGHQFAWLRCPRSSNHDPEVLCEHVETDTCNCALGMPRFAPISLRLPYAVVSCLGVRTTSCTNSSCLCLAASLSRWKGQVTSYAPNSPHPEDRGFLWLNLKAPHRFGRSNSAMDGIASGLAAVSC